jgi:hypothetical protein
LYKYPGAQIHWTNYYGVLSRAQLDARKLAGIQAEAANALSCLAELYNNYEGFTPQNAMVAYVYNSSARMAVKKILMSQVKMSGLILLIILMTLNLQTLVEKVLSGIVLG